MDTATVALCDCGHPPTPQEVDSITTGYGTGRDDKTACFACCAEIDRAAMIADGKAHLYLTGNRAEGYKVSNWPGSLAFVPSRFQEKQTNQGFGWRTKTRVDVWFAGPDGYEWHGYHASDWSSIISVRRTKKMVWPVRKSCDPGRRSA